jgi:hypothetical protein
LSLGTGAVKIKKEDIGVFDPYYEDPDDIGIVHDGKNLVFTDIICFKERINSFLDNEDTRHANETQLVALFQTLLAGPAIIWWSTEVPMIIRRRYLASGIDKIMAVMSDRFGADPAEATAKYTSLTLRLKDLASSEYALSQYVTKKLRYARQIGILPDDNQNWRGVIIQV